MKVRPLHDRILIKRIEEKESVKGGIIIPDSAKEKPQEGEVTGALVARMLRDKGVLDVFAAIRRLRTQGLPVRLLLAGPTDPTTAAPGTIRGDLARDWGLPVRRLRNGG